jgi:hypothetical protein
VAAKMAGSMVQIQMTALIVLSFYFKQVQAHPILTLKAKHHYIQHVKLEVLVASQYC